MRLTYRVHIKGLLISYACTLTIRVTIAAVMKRSALRIFLFDFPVAPGKKIKSGG